MRFDPGAQRRGRRGAVEPAQQLLLQPPARGEARTVVLTIPPQLADDNGHANSVDCSTRCRRPDAADVTVARQRISNPSSTSTWRSIASPAATVTGDSSGRKVWAKLVVAESPGALRNVMPGASVEMKLTQTPWSVPARATVEDALPPTRRSVAWPSSTPGGTGISGASRSVSLKRAG